MLCICLKISGLPKVGVLSAWNNVYQWFQRVMQ
jgi:hypothetical protein